MANPQKALEILVEKPTGEKLKNLGVEKWPTWTSEVKTFDWEYDSEETCYFLEGRVKVKTPDGETAIEKGDLAVFPKGLRCTWQVLEPVRKVYRFA